MLEQTPAQKRPSVNSEASKAEPQDEPEKRSFLDTLTGLCCSSWQRMAITACAVLVLFCIALLCCGSKSSAQPVSKGSSASTLAPIHGAGYKHNEPHVAVPYYGLGSLCGYEGAVGFPGVKLISEAKGEVLPYQGDIQLLTFNILAEIWEGSGIEAERNQKILEAIQARHPDVILLQEAQDTSVNFILEGLNKGLSKDSPFGFEQVAFPHLDKTCWGDWLLGRAWRPNGQAILMKRKLVPHIVRAEALNVSNPSDPGFYEPAVTLRMARHSSVAKRLPAAQLEYKDVCITNVHLWYGLMGGPRKVQFDKIKRWVNAEKAAKRFDHILIAGDFNDVSGSLMKENASLFRNHGNDHGLQEIDTCSNGNFSVRLDYVLSDPELISLECTCPNENPKGFGFSLMSGSPFNWNRPWFSKTVSKEGIIAKYGSDHLPVTSLVRLQ